MIRIFALLFFLLPATGALAAPAWTQWDTEPGDGAWWALVTPGVKLVLGCRTDGDLSYFLTGIAGELPKVVQDLVDPIPYRWTFGGARPVTVMGGWSNPVENYISGSLPPDPELLGQIEAAERLRIEARDGTVLLDTAMEGSKWVRFTFGEACGL